MFKHTLTRETSELVFADFIDSSICEISTFVILNKFWESERFMRIMRKMHLKFEKIACCQILELIIYWRLCLIFYPGCAVSWENFTSEQLPLALQLWKPGLFHVFSVINIIFYLLLIKQIYQKTGIYIILYPTLYTSNYLYIYF
jgi:hypothetical protein